MAQYSAPTYVQKKTEKRNHPIDHPEDIQYLSSSDDEYLEKKFRFARKISVQIQIVMRFLNC